MHDFLLEPTFWDSTSHWRRWRQWTTAVSRRVPTLPGITCALWFHSPPPPSPWQGSTSIRQGLTLDTMPRPLGLGLRVPRPLFKKCTTKWVVCFVCRRELLHPLQKKGGGGGGIVKSSLHKCIGVWHIIAKQIVLVCLNVSCYQPILHPFSHALREWPFRKLK